MCITEWADSETYSSMKLLLTIEYLSKRWGEVTKMRRRQLIPSCAFCRLTRDGDVCRQAPPRNHPNKSHLGSHRKCCRKEMPSCLRNPVLLRSCAAGIQASCPAQESRISFPGSERKLKNNPRQYQISLGEKLLLLSASWIAYWLIQSAIAALTLCAIFGLFFSPQFEIATSRVALNILFLPLGPTTGALLVKYVWCIICEQVLVLLTAHHILTK